MVYRRCWKGGCLGTSELELVGQEGMEGYINLISSLKKFTLYGCIILGEEDMTKLPCCSILKCSNWFAMTLRRRHGSQGKVYKNLKDLQLDSSNMVNWTVDETHYPKLKHLIIRVYIASTSSKYQLILFKFLLWNWLNWKNVARLLQGKYRKNSLTWAMMTSRFGKLLYMR